MAFNVGVNVVEVDGTAAPVIEAAPTAVAGFLLRSQRGVPNRPVPVFSFADFVARFGGYTPTAFGPHALRGFFDNGGRQAYVVRVVNRATAKPASTVLTDRDGTPKPTLRLAAGQHGQTDPGGWGDAVSVRVVDHPLGTSFLPAQLVQVVAAGGKPEPLVLADGDTLTVTVNSTAAPPVTFRPGDFAAIGAATTAEVVAAINRQAAGFRAEVGAGRLITVATAATGHTARIQVAGTAAAKLGLTAAPAEPVLPVGTTFAAVQSTAGFSRGTAVRLESRGRLRGTALAPPLAAGAGLRVRVDAGLPTERTTDVVFAAADFVGGLATITAAEAAIAINRQARGFIATLLGSDRLVLISDSYGPGSAIAVTAPAAGPDARQALGLDAPATDGGGREHRELTSVSEQERLIAWSGGLASVLPTYTGRIQSTEFDLVVRRGGAEVERHESLSMQKTLPTYAPTVVNDAGRGSAYLTVTDLGSTSGAGLNVPAETAVPLGQETAGNDGNAPVPADFIGEPDRRTGLYAFDTADIQLLATPETTDEAVVSAALAYCEIRGDAMFVGTVPPDLDLPGVKTYAASLRARKVYGALYAPWIWVANPLDATGNHPRVLVPPVGHILGVYARIGDLRGVWKAPAGDEARLAGVLAVRFDMTDTDHTDLVRDGGVNGVRAIPGAGVVLDSSRSLSTDPRWLFVGTRRLFNLVKTSLRTSLQWVPQQPHSAALRRRVALNVVTPFLLGLWSAGAFGSGRAEDLFTVRCDETNNPAAQVDLGNFTLEVYFYPVRPAETIVVVVGQQDSGGSAAES
jgi:phage tail sheath protein FI